MAIDLRDDAAWHAGSSPGDLCCWFTDRDEIVGDLSDWLAAAYDEMWDTGRGDLDDLAPDELIGRFSAAVPLSRRYPFLAASCSGCCTPTPGWLPKMRRSARAAPLRSWR